ACPALGHAASGESQAAARPEQRPRRRRGESAIRDRCSSVHRSKDCCERNKKGRGTSLRRRTTTSILKRDRSRQSRPPGAVVRKLSARAAAAHEPILPGECIVPAKPASSKHAGGFNVLQAKTKQAAPIDS